MNKSNKSRIVIVVHFLCWMILTAGLLFSHPPDWGGSLPSVFWIKQIVLLFLLIVVFYLNLNVFVPRYLLHKKVWSYIFVILSAAVVTTFLNSLTDYIFNLNSDVVVFDPSHHPHIFRGYHQDDWAALVFGMILLVNGLGITISFIEKWNEEMHLRQRLEQEKVSAELTALKAQINPHFFFNTLNNIYSYTITDGDVARDAITNLSKMMRYVLYETTAEKTPLSKEIEFIEEYIALMKLRVSEKTEVTFIVSEQLLELTIAPMLLLPFVENAFKHGNSGLFDGYIHIAITQTASTVLLLIENSIFETANVSTEENNGIGIANTTRRLSLLYPGKHELNMGKISKTAYEVRLLIWV